VIGVENLDRILDRHDMRPSRAVDVVDHRRKRCRLARSGRPRDEHEPTMFVGKALDDSGQPELGEPRRLTRDHPERKRGRAALAKRVDAEPRQPGRRVRNVEVARLLKALVASRCGSGQVA
jgi:hypothetical protein